MTVAVIVPWGKPPGHDGAYRAAVWKKLKSEWEAMIRTSGRGAPTVGDRDRLVLAEAADPLHGKVAPPAHVDGYTANREPSVRPFSVSRAINAAVRSVHRATGATTFVCMGADMRPDLDVVDWAAAELGHRPWTLLFDRGSSLSEQSTTRWLRGMGILGWPETERFQTPCVGPIAFTLKAFNDVGGFDERYEGWAFEDVDFWHRLGLTLGHQTRCSDRPLRQYWHPIGHHDLTFANPNVRLYHDTWQNARPSHV